MASGETFTKLYIDLWHRDYPNRIGEINEDHSPEQVASILNHLESTGWKINDVEIHTDYNSGEFINVKSLSVLAAIFDALATDPENAGVIIAYGELFGWDSDEPFTQSRYGRPYLEGYQGVYDSESQFMAEWLEQVDYLPENLPSWIVIDHEETFNNVRDDFQTYEYGSELYVFTNH